MKQMPKQIDWVSTSVELHAAAYDTVTKAELEFYKARCQKMARDIESMCDELKQGKPVWFNGMTIFQKMPDGVINPLESSV